MTSIRERTARLQRGSVSREEQIDPAQIDRSRLLPASSAGRINTSIRQTICGSRDNHIGPESFREENTNFRSGDGLRSIAGARMLGFADVVEDTSSVRSPARADIDSEFPEVVPGLVAEVERPTWIALIKLVQLLSPDLYRGLQPALNIGQVPIKGILLQEEEADALEFMCRKVWGDQDLIMPIVRYKTYCVDYDGFVSPTLTHPPILVCPRPSISVVVIEATTCSPYEKRILNAKEKVSQVSPDDALGLGCRLASGTYSNQLPTPDDPPTVAHGYKISDQVTVTRRGFFKRRS